MSLSTSAQALQEHVNSYANEIVALFDGKKSAAPKARKHLQMLRELSARLRSEVLDHTKPKKNDTAPVTAATDTAVATAAAAILELASSPAENSEPAPKPKRVRKAPKKSI